MILFGFIYLPQITTLLWLYFNSLFIVPVIQSRVGLILRMIGMIFLPAADHSTVSRSKSNMYGVGGMLQLRSVAYIPAAYKLRCKALFLSQNPKKMARLNQ